MRSGAIPFQLDLTDILGSARREVSKRVGDVTLNLPFISIAVSPKDREKRIAREIVVRLKDRRVLSAWECCDNCIDQALASLQEIRRFLVDKEVELADVSDGPLYLLVEAMLQGIRQFLTFEQGLKKGDSRMPPDTRSEFRRPADVREIYFDGLEMLRGHLSRCLGQIATIAGTGALPSGLIQHYQGPWPLEAYKRPAFPEE